MKKPGKNPAEFSAQEDADELMEVDAYEELAVFFDEESPMKLVAHGWRAGEFVPSV
jgi:hypothetical protein